MSLMPTVANASRKARAVTTCDLYRRECQTITAATMDIKMRSAACEVRTCMAATW